MSYEHDSGLPNAFLRARGKQEQQAVVFYGEDTLIQGAELNDAQEIQRARHNRLGRLVARDGDRIIAGDAVVDIEAKTVSLMAGQIWVEGDAFPVASTVLTAVPMTGRVEIGVRLVRSYITHEQDPDLLGLVPGSLAEGEPGAAREIARIAWGRADVEEPGTFYPVYLLQDGTILDQTPPPALDGVVQAIALYDRAHGHYIVKGCRVTALGSVDGYQEFSIEQGEANISGFKRTRNTSLRHRELEDWDEQAVPGETKTYPGGASAEILLDFGPIATINSILLTKEKTATITRGAIAHGLDALPDTSVIQIIEVKQGATVYAVNTSYVRTNNSVDWAPAGAEPATGSTYTVKYRYRDSVDAVSATNNSIVVEGGATGGDVIIAYTFKLPRIDLLCLQVDGSPVYVKGIPARQNPLPPVAPLEVLPLCEITNSWVGKPLINNNGVRSVEYGEMWRYFNRVLDNTRLIELERLKSGIDSREPVAKKGMFVDPFIDDTYRDQGLAQTAAVGNGMMQLGIDVTIFYSTLAAPVMLDYLEQVVVSQKLKTGCVPINPYANFTPLPGTIKITRRRTFGRSLKRSGPPHEHDQFNRGVRTDGGPLQSVSQASKVVDHRQEQAEFLRSINVGFLISGFGIGEVLKTLTFDDVNVKPAGVQAGNSLGQISGSFTIPANTPVGTKEIKVEGQGGTRARAMFTGQGVIDIEVMRRITTIEHWNAPPPLPEPPEPPEPQPEPEPGEPPIPPPPPPPIVKRPERSLFNNNGRGVDPQAQNFALTEPRQLVGVNFHICKVGNPGNALLINQVYVDNGVPTTDVMAESLVPMAGAAVGWKNARYKYPVFTGDEQSHAIVIKSDDNVHAVSIAALGGFDADLQQKITVHPYPVGPRSSSVNAESWTFHQGEALTFELVAAWYQFTKKTVELGSFNLVACSDLQVRAAIELPSPACSVVFEIIRPNGTVYRLLPYQVLSLTEFITETVQLRAILIGTTKLSPTLYAPVQLLAGKIRTTGSYVTRAFNLGNNVRLTSYIKAALPAGSSLTVQYDKADGTWVTLPLVATEALSDPAWVENKYDVSGITATQGRIRLNSQAAPPPGPALAILAPL